MKRLFYLAIGVGVGVAAVQRATKAARKFTPSGISGSVGESLSGVGASVRAFFDDVRIGMTEREVELHHALVGDEHETPVTERRHTSGNGS